ncbi:MAG: ATP-binding cassette domain-containing protein [Caldiserica bacterium]|nr:ATP-binding cassette domain-containing protein [Caldisericota bacterium]
MALLEVKELSKGYGNIKAVGGISFEIQKGEIFGLLGPNGAGKTTTISMLSCLIKPDSGDAFVDGCSILKDSMEVKKRIGVVPQDVSLYPTLSAQENLVFFGEMYGLTGSKLREKVDDVLEVVGLKDRRKEAINKYSGGMKRRINIAVGLLPSPKLLILDEPTVGVDPQSRTNILETLKELNKKGLTILYTSHYMEEVEFLCHRIAIMDLGKIIAIGSLNELRLLVGERDLLRISTANEISKDLVETVKKIPDVSEARVLDESIEILTLHGRKLLPQIIEIFADTGVKIKSVEVKEPNLESVFLHLTGKELRD